MMGHRSWVESIASGALLLVVFYSKGALSETVLQGDYQQQTSTRTWNYDYNARRPGPSLNSMFGPDPTDTDTDTDTDDEEDRMSIANMTCEFFTQPLNHFVPRGRSPSYQQRYCVYSEYAAVDNSTATSPILFYTGNESPLEQYINHTGLMWELAPTLGARIVFAEHRYEGQSLPPMNLSTQCLSYASTAQALADYANLLERHLNPGHTAPVIVFGGSYGGMLSGWMRMKYPHLVAGAVAASAPIGAFPQSAAHNIDGSARVLQHGLQQTYPPDATVVSDDTESSTTEHNHCSTNLLAAWPLMTWLVEQHPKANGGADFLQDTFRLCDPLTDGDAKPLLRWAQSIWFDLAEGSFPYPSSYVPFALMHKKVNLPAWPLQAACWNTSQLHQDWGVQFLGDDVSRGDIRYQIVYGDSGLTLDVDWDNVTLVHDANNAPSSSLERSKDIVGLLTGVRDAVSIWYNITKDVQCYNVTQPAPNMMHDEELLLEPAVREQQERQLLLRPNNSNNNNNKDDPAKICHDKMKQVGSWEPVCCNDEMNLIITEAQGLGRDFFWPPSHPRGTETYEDIVRNVTPEPCPDPGGIFGYSKEPYELWSTWLDAYYGGINMDGHSNIIFSNGLLDPWSAGGVYATNPFEHDDSPYDGPMLQNITENDVLALIIEYGGHHTDLMYSSKLDPNCVKEARRIEKDYVAKWIADWKK
jgi:pimeloyl-ACP methyl ester carboxylesterase